jgi:muramoyltetrapeptide carboxypeptidase
LPLQNTKLIIPSQLQEGDTVAFTAPASPISMGSIAAYVRFFKSKGCKTIIGDTIRKQKNEYRYFSAPDEVRAEELNSMFADKDIKAIICGRGGYGVSRILPHLNYEALKQNPKIIMGYSDITALHLAVYRQSELVAYHGPVASSKLTEEHKKNIENMFFNSKEKIKYSLPEMKTINSGVATGKLQGGNLSLIAATMGTPYEIDLDNSILFIEDTNVLAHEFDRMLTQLLISNKFSGCKGIIIGKMRRFDIRGNFYPNRAFTILEVLEQLIKPLDIPCVYNLPFGHIESQLIFPLGLNATINSKEKSLEIDLKQ